MEPNRINDTDEFEVPVIESPPAYERVQPRYFGLTPHHLVAALGVVALLAAVVLLALGSAAVGLLLFVTALLLGALFAEQARRRRASSIDRAAAAAIDRSLALMGFTRATVGAWTGAGRRAAKLRLEAVRLARERSHVQYELGGAVHADDEARTEELRQRMRDLDAELERRAREARAAIDEAHRRTRQEQRAVSATQIRRPDSTPR
jgi:hypothetical protein